MSLQDDKEATRRRKSSKTPTPGPDEKPAPARGARKSGGDVGRALRSAYHEVVDETVPPEMLDLLGKLS